MSGEVRASGDPVAAAAAPTTAASARRSAAVAGILLAAGTSSRMGRNKMLFELGGESLLRGAARRALAGGLAPLIVVLGHDAERARLELDGLPCLITINPDYESGINSSLRSGVTALPAGTAAAMVLLADMPHVSAEMIAEMAAQYRASDAPLVISDYEGVHAPPMVYDRALFGELLAMTGEGCGRQVVKRHRHEADVLPWPVARLDDIDVPADYARLVTGAEDGSSQGNPHAL